jgi:hypothetical protein
MFLKILMKIEMFYSGHSGSTSTRCFKPNEQFKLTQELAPE